MNHDDRATTGWNVYWVASLRTILGLYLLVHFLLLLPWSDELFSREGMVPDDALSPLMQLFPNVLSLCDSPLAVRALMGFGASAALSLVWGGRDRLAAFAAWYVLAALFGRNPLINNPSLPHIGWMLLLFAFLPSTPSLWRLWRHRKVPDRFVLPQKLWDAVWNAAWIVAGASYTYSAITKIGSVSWMDGSALWYLLHNPLARPSVLQHWLLMHPVLLTAASLFALVLELFALPLSLWGPARRPLWFALLGMHIGLLLLVDFADLTLGMIISHLLLADPRWFRLCSVDHAPSGTVSSHRLPPTTRPRGGISAADPARSL